MTRRSKMPQDDLGGAQTPPSPQTGLQSAAMSGSDQNLSSSDPYFSP